MGVRSSWDTLAIRSLRIRSTTASSSAMALNARASSPTSSADVSVTRPRQWPSAMFVAAMAISRSGDVMPRVSTCTSARAMTIEIDSRTHTGQCQRSPTTATALLTNTPSTIVMPSFSLMEPMRSRGRNSAHASRQRSGITGSPACPGGWGS
jgi:hypothetical protein